MAPPKTPRLSNDIGRMAADQGHGQTAPTTGSPPRRANQPQADFPFQTWWKDVSDLTGCHMRQTGAGPAQPLVACSIPGLLDDTASSLSASREDGRRDCDLVMWERGSSPLQGLRRSLFNFNLLYPGPPSSLSIASREH